MYSSTLRLQYDVATRALVCLVLCHYPCPLSSVLVRESGPVGNQPLRVNMFRSSLLAFLASSLSITGASSFHVRSSVRTVTSSSTHAASGIFTFLILFFSSSSITRSNKLGKPPLVLPMIVYVTRHVILTKPSLGPSGVKIPKRRNAAFVQLLL